MLGSTLEDGLAVIDHDVVVAVFGVSHTAAFQRLLPNIEGNNVDD